MDRGLCFAVHVTTRGRRWRQESHISLIVDQRLLILGRYPGPLHAHHKHHDDDEEHGEGRTDSHRNLLPATVQRHQLIVHRAALPPHSRMSLLMQLVEQFVVQNAVDLGVVAVLIG